MSGTAKGNNSFVLYDSWFPLFTVLPDESAGKLIKLLFQYRIARKDGQDPKQPEGLTPEALAMYTFMIEIIEMNMRKYAEKCRTNSQNRTGKTPTTVDDR